MDARRSACLAASGCALLGTNDEETPMIILGGMCQSKPRKLT
jgi:hypothetical protein